MKLIDLTTPTVGKVEGVQLRNANEQVRSKHAHQYDVEEANRHLADIALREKLEQYRAEGQRQNTEIAAADLQRENEKLAVTRWIAKHEAALPKRKREQEREMERERIDNAIHHSQEVGDPPQSRREAPRSARDRDADVAQEAHR